jgi:hypothetical protein
MRSFRRWLPVPLLALSVSAARADMPVPAAPPEEPARPQLLSRSLPLPRSDQDKDTAPEPTDTLRLDLHKGAGLEISKPVRFADHELVFGLKGPLMKRNRVGLLFEVRF